MRHRRADPQHEEERLPVGLADLLLRNSPAGFAVPVGDGWRRVSAADFRHDVTAAAKGFAAIGVDSGDRIVLACRTRYEWAVLAFAAWAMRGIVVPVHPRIPLTRLWHILHDVRANMIIGDRPLPGRFLAEARRSLPLVRALRVGGPASPGDAPDAMQEVAAAGAYMDHSAVTERSRSVAAEDAAVITYPALWSPSAEVQGVVLTHGNLLASAAGQLRAAGPLLDRVPDDEADILFHLPLAGAPGQSLLIACLMAGVRVAFPPPAVHASPMQQTRAYGPSIAIARAPHIERAFDAAVEHAVKTARSGRRSRPGMLGRVSHAMHEWLYTRVRDRFGGRARLIICPGGVSEEVADFLTGAGMAVVQGTGIIAEASGPIAVRVPGRTVEGSAGRPLPGLELRDGPRGEVEISGATVSPAYWNAPDPSRTPTRREDGWLRTGLTGRVHHDGTASLAGRTTASGRAPAIARVRPPGEPPAEEEPRGPREAPGSQGSIGR
ncbi:AMP-binding protein [Streptomonospora wellingtoniae]|uniref:AMP-binding protein n=1 Tax=Streptomonospora wellingtoniae TaxID=3075544 RepID=A0ABU2L1X5_9ACTN|nr:AMP-binding protein [Streptomonospora sp. DSM 45055]MDT0305273.1 AMP-binding protein [Streptomonospora sp. DSM 45055]